MHRLARAPLLRSLKSSAALSSIPRHSPELKLNLRAFCSSPRASDAFERAKRAAGYAAVSRCLLPSHRVIGIGSGSTVVAVVDALRDNVKVHRDRLFVPTSFQSRNLIIDAGLPLAAIEDTRSIDVTFDGADDIDLQLNAIKGGGACHLREKVVAELSKEFVLVADWRKKSNALGGGDWKKGVPIEVVPFAADFVMHSLATLAQFDGPQLKLRMGGSAKAGPVVTDNGNLVLDAVFSPALMSEPGKLLGVLKAQTGVVEVGLFVGMARRAFIGMEDGSVEELTPQ